MAEVLGFIGLGNMGRAMAGHLLASDYRLHVYNRTPEKAEALIAEGARLMFHPSDAAEPGEALAGALTLAEKNGTDRTRVTAMLAAEPVAVPVRVSLERLSDESLR
jgi:3-hydroxyisobutyrate dehydrogenase-like beta-hydroxyacid dehydrogenase